MSTWTSHKSFAPTPSPNHVQWNVNIQPRPTQPEPHHHRTSNIGIISIERQHLTPPNQNPIITVASTWESLSIERQHLTPPNPNPIITVASTWESLSVERQHLTPPNPNPIITVASTWESVSIERQHPTPFHKKNTYSHIKQQWAELDKIEKTTKTWGKSWRQIINTPPEIRLIIIPGFCRRVRSFFIYPDRMLDSLYLTKIFLLFYPMILPSYSQPSWCDIPIIFPIFQSYSYHIPMKFPSSSHEIHPSCCMGAQPLSAIGHLLCETHGPRRGQGSEAPR